MDGQLGTRRDLGMRNLCEKYAKAMRKKQTAFSLCVRGPSGLQQSEPWRKLGRVELYTKRVNMEHRNLGGARLKARMQGSRTQLGSDCAPLLSLLPN